MWKSPAKVALRVAFWKETAWIPNSARNFVAVLAPDELSLRSAEDRMAPEDVLTRVQADIALLAGAWGADLRVVLNSPTNGFTDPIVFCNCLIRLGFSFEVLATRDPARVRDEIDIPDERTDWELYSDLPNVAPIIERVRNVCNR